MAWALATETAHRIPPASIIGFLALCAFGYAMIMWRKRRSEEAERKRRDARPPDHNVHETAMEARPVPSPPDGGGPPAPAAGPHDDA